MRLMSMGLRGCSAFQPFQVLGVAGQEDLQPVRGRG